MVQKQAAKYIIGRRVSHVVTHLYKRRLGQLRLVFSDGTDYEFHTPAMFRLLDNDRGAPCGLVGRVIISAAVVCNGIDDSTVSFLTADGFICTFASSREIRLTGGLDDKGIQVVLRSSRDCVLTHYSGITDDDAVPESLVLDERLIELLNRLGIDAIRRGTIALTEYDGHLDIVGDWDRNFLALAYGAAGALRAAVQAYPSGDDDITIGSGDEFFRIVGAITGLGGDAAELHRLYVLQPSRVRRLAAYLSGSALWLEIERDAAKAKQVDLAMADAAALMRSGRHREAIPILAHVVATDPLNYFACAELAAAFREVQAYDQAIRAWEYATSVRPDYAAAYMELGLLLIELGRSDAGLQSMERGVAAEPRDAMTHYYLGVVYSKLRRRSELQREIAILEKLNPEWAAELRAEEVKARPRFASEGASWMERRIAGAWEVVARRFARVVVQRRVERRQVARGAVR